MVRDIFAKPIIFGVLLVLSFVATTTAQEVGGIRGVVYDKDFDVPMPGVQVSINETGQTVTTTDEGTFVFARVDPNTYTLVFAKEGYTRQFTPNVVVSGGRMTEVNVSMAGEFTEMEEFVVQDLELGGSEIGLLNLRREMPSILDSIGADLMSQAGSSNAADALRLVAGATVEDGKYAVVRGLPDRYVNSQLNAVRLPTADVDKRAVQLDQFPAALVESIQVSKTFTPDQQGDASGGAVNLVLKGIPDDRIVKAKVGAEYNSQVKFGDDFLSYDGGGADFWGLDDSRDIPRDGNFGGAMGVSEDDAPPIYSGSFTAGDQYEMDSGLRLGGLLSMYYKHDASYFEGGKNDVYNARLDGDRYVLEPLVREETTTLFDVTEGTEEVKWGVLGALGAEMDNHALSLMYMRTQVTQDKATLLEDVRGASYRESLDIAAPWHRSEALEYTERTQETIQLKGQHTLDVPDYRLGRFMQFLDPEFDWTLAHSEASMDSPDKRLFSTQWKPEQIRVIGNTTFVSPALHTGYDPSGSGYGFAQRIWKDITEESDQFFTNGRLPFEQWSGEKGYLKLGFFTDAVTRQYNEDSFFYETGGSYEGQWDDLWSAVYLDEERAIEASDQDVDYTGTQDITAWYYMMDLPLTAYLKVVGGARHESTDLEIVNHPESANAQYLPPRGSGWTRFGPEADVSYSQDDVLPAIGVEFVPIEKIKVRASYSETVARQTFKELSPVMQMEYLGANIFVGNSELTMSALKNYDLRIDYEPYTGGLISASWFRKDVTDPIEYVQRFQASLFYTTAVNYPEGWLEGYEVEIRQELGRLWEPLEGFSLGANATFIDSEVTLPENEAQAFANVGVPTKTRDMMNAPEYLYNLNLTYEYKKYGTRVGIFYTVRGDTLAEGGVALGRSYVPDVYEKEYGTLNVGVSQPLGERTKLSLQAKNLTNPKIERVYRSNAVDGEATKTSYKKGIDVVVSMEHEF